MAIAAETTTVAAPHHDSVHRTAMLLRGLFALLLGACALYFRVYSTLLVGAFVAFAIVDGIVRVILAVRSTGRDKAWMIHGLEGIITIVVGVLAWRFAHSLTALTWTVAEWAFGIGVLTIAFAALSRGRLKDAWLWMLSGILLIVLGAAMPWFTLGGLLAPGVVLGLFAIVYGLVSLVIAVRHKPQAAASAIVTA